MKKTPKNANRLRKSTPPKLRKNALLGLREKPHIKEVKYFSKDGFLIKPIPKSGDKISDGAFASIAAQVLDHWEVCNNKPSNDGSASKRTSFDKHNNPPFSRTQNFTKRCIYELGCAVFEESLERFLKKHTERLFKNGPEAMKIYNTSPSPTYNPFAWGYLMIFGIGITWRTENQNTTDGNEATNSHLSGGSFTLTRSARYRASRELLYAYKHKVPSDYLVGFISQCGGHERIIPRTNERKREEWYKRRSKVLPITSP